MFNLSITHNNHRAQSCCSQEFLNCLETLKHFTFQAKLSSGEILHVEIIVHQKNKRSFDIKITDQQHKRKNIHIENGILKYNVTGFIWIPISQTEEMRQLLCVLCQKDYRIKSLNDLHSDHAKNFLIIHINEAQIIKIHFKNLQENVILENFKYVI